jgi:transcriptional repressor NrdR
MRCPFCGSSDSKVVDSREARNSVRRRRVCLNPTCGGRFSTEEHVIEVALLVLKRDGHTEAFSRVKLERAMKAAAHKRPVRDEQIAEVAESIEADVYGRGAADVPSRVLARLVMERLKALDPLSHVRFAVAYDGVVDVPDSGSPAGASRSLRTSAQLPLLDVTELEERVPRVGTRRRRPVRAPGRIVALPRLEATADHGEDRRTRGA